MATAKAGPSGAWEGSLIDALGYEGTLTLELRGRGGKLKGRFVATIADHHEPFVRTGEVAGTASGDDVALSLTFARQQGEEEVRIELHGHTFKLSDEGVGMCGTYEVAARSFSPLQGGVVALARDRRPTLTEAKGTAR